MTLSGSLIFKVWVTWTLVLIPLLVDDPLWVFGNIKIQFSYGQVLIPLLVDDPLWAVGVIVIACLFAVLSPLLVDDPLWVP